TLLGVETPLWLDAAAHVPEVTEWLRFHCGVPLVDAPEFARFALIVAPSTMRGFDAFDAGTDALPDRSATLILQVEGLEEGLGRRLAGPGIAEAAHLAAHGGPAGFWPFQPAPPPRFPPGSDHPPR